MQANGVIQRKIKQKKLRKPCKRFVECRIDIANASCYHTVYFITDNGLTYGYRCSMLALTASKIFRDFVEYIDGRKRKKSTVLDLTTLKNCQNAFDIAAVTADSGVTRA